MARRGHPLAGQHLPDRQPEDFQVQQEGPVVDVPHVEPELLLPTDRVSSVHLRPAGDARLDLVPAQLLGGVEGQVLGEQGARADERHVARNDIPKRGQLVEAGGAQEPAKAREADGISRQRVLVRPGITHRLELVERERLAVEADAGLAEEQRHPVR